MLEIPAFPLFSQLGRERLLSVQKDGLESEIVRVRAKLVRSFEAESEVDAIFVPKIGCEFVTPTDEFLDMIKNYVSVFSRNMIFFIEFV